MTARATRSTTSRMIRLRVRFLRSRSSWPGGGPAGGTAMVRPVVIGTAWVAADRGHHRGEAGVPRLDGPPVGEAQEVGAQLLGRAVAVVGVLGHGLHDHGLERRRHRRVRLARQHGLVADVLGGDGHRRVAREGGTADGHFVEDDAERVDVAARVHPLALGLLG